MGRALAATRVVASFFDGAGRLSKPGQWRVLSQSGAGHLDAGRAAAESACRVDTVDRPGRCRRGRGTSWGLYRADHADRTKQTRITRIARIEPSCYQLEVL